MPPKKQATVEKVHGLPDDAQQLQEQAQEVGQGSDVWHHYEFPSENKQHQSEELAEATLRFCVRIAAVQKPEVPAGLVAAVLHQSPIPLSHCVVAGCLSGKLTGAKAVKQRDEQCVVLSIAITTAAAGTSPPSSAADNNIELLGMLSWNGREHCRRSNNDNNNPHQNSSTSAAAGSGPTGTHADGTHHLTITVRSKNSRPLLFDVLPLNIKHIVDGPYNHSGFANNHSGFDFLAYYAADDRLIGETLAAGRGPYMHEAALGHFLEGMCLPLGHRRRTKEEIVRRVFAIPFYGQDYDRANESTFTKVFNEVRRACSGDPIAVALLDLKRLEIISEQAQQYPAFLQDAQELHSQCEAEHGPLLGGPTAAFAPFEHYFWKATMKFSRAMMVASLLRHDDGAITARATPTAGAPAGGDDECEVALDDEVAWLRRAMYAARRGVTACSRPLEGGYHLHTHRVLYSQYFNQFNGDLRQQQQQQRRAEPHASTPFTDDEAPEFLSFDIDRVDDGQLEGTQSVPSEFLRRVCLTRSNKALADAAAAENRHVKKEFLGRYKYQLQGPPTTGAQADSTAARLPEVEPSAVAVAS